jgi:hypothetical protein
MKSSLRIFLVFVVMLATTGCASISLHNSWKDPGAAAKQYRKLLVVGVAEKPQMRQVFEEVFAAEVNKKGFTGIASYTITGVKDKPSRTALEEAVKKSGADGVITTRLVAMKKDTDVRTGFVMTDRGYTNTAFMSPELYPSSLYDFYGVNVQYATFEHKSVEITLSKKAIVETNLFDAGTGRLIWSGTSTAVNPEGIITISRDLADSVIKALAKDGLL